MTSNIFLSCYAVYFSVLVSILQLSLKTYLEFNVFEVDVAQFFTISHAFSKLQPLQAYFSCNSTRPSFH